ncbi:very short patch repair endonuclease [uncultured Roseibium sp.]|uniref:very short patch repair endonuclease n=1 Tax=uncultured Roseibium sp. TaxID=1936171 RepID=UPI002596F238|nr:very short patch repair endonuclease [uncultured Roseibium sp.]
MTDRVSKSQRSENMRRIRSRDMKPEMIVRKLVHSMGYRYRLHRKDLPGKPDLVFGPRKAVVFVHGCFWHQHTCRDGRLPKSNTSYWHAKLEQNVVRDAKVRSELEQAGWTVLVVWECQTKNVEELKERISTFLEVDAQ